MSLLFTLSLLVFTSAAMAASCDHATTEVSRPGTPATCTGAMDDFARAADVPWADAAGKITAVMVSEDVILGKNALAGFADTMTVNGLSISFQKMVAASTDSAEPSGAISGAELERIAIMDGKAYLGVSVYTNSEVKARGEGWGIATNGVIEVPAPGKQGFFYLMSKPAAPSDAIHAPFPVLK